MKPKTFSFIWICLLPVLFILLFSQSVLAANSRTSGTSGTCSWKITDGTLTIYPTEGSSCTLADSPDSHLFGPEWTERDDVKKIVIKQTVYAAQDSTYLFYGLANLVDISGLTQLNVSNVETMWHMFRKCTSLTDLTALQTWDVSKVPDMDGMFSGCTSLTGLTGLQNWNVSNVKYMSGMFSDCTSLTDLTALQNWNVSNVTSMHDMFSYCSSLTDLTGLQNWNVSNVGGMADMFCKCESLTNLTALKNWDVSNVTNMIRMFYHCKSLTNLTGLQSWDVSNVRYMEGMFYDCHSLTDLTALQNWNVSNVTDMSYMFKNCFSLTNLTGLQSWDVSNVMDMGYMFNWCTSLTDLTGLQNWDVSNVTNMYSMFYYCYSLTNLTGLQSWDVSNVTDMRDMFAWCESLTNLTGLQNWNVSNVTNMWNIYAHVPGYCSDTPAEDLSNSDIKNKCFTPWVSGLSVTPGGNSLKLTWTSLSGAKSYEVYQCTSDTASTCATQKTKGLTSASYNITGLNYDTTYYFNVRALMSTGDYSQYSSVVSAVPVQVSGLKAVLSRTTVKLSWSKLTGAKSYVIYRSTSASSGFAKIGTSTGTSYNATGLKSGTTYYFKVYAVLSKGSSGFSSVVSAKPCVVSGLKAVLSRTTAKLSWSKLSGAKSYVIYRSTSASSGFAKIGTSTGTSYNVTGLKSGTTYYFKVYAELSNGTSSFSSVVSAKPCVVTGLKADVSGTTVKLSWSKLTGAKSYVVYRSTSASTGFAKIGTSTGTSYNATGLHYGTTYYFKVYAVLSNGTSSFSSAVSANLCHVKGLKVSFNGSTAKLSWSKLSNAKTYYVYRSTSASSGFEKIGTASGTSYSVKSLKEGKTYYFKVRAKLSSGAYSEYSAAVAAAKPGGLKAKVSGNSANVSWSKLSGAKTYEIYRSTSKTSGFKKVETGSGNSYSAKSLSYGKTYYFKVRAKLSTGEYSAYSAVVKAAIPPQVKGLKATLKGTSVKLSWDKLTGAKSYEFYVTNTATGNSAHDSCTANYAKITVGYGKSYSFKVRAKLSSGFSAYSDTVTVKVPKKAAAASASRAAVSVGELSATVSGQSVKLSWEKLAGAKSYEIYRSASKNSGYEKIGTATKASYEAAKQGYGQTRYYKVRALLSDKTYSEYSSAVKAVIPAAPTAVPTVVPTRTAVPTAAPVQAEDHAANITEECSADGSSCTVVEKVCTETECTITSKVCVAVGDQRACADPVVTVVPVLTETPVVTEMAASEVTPTVEAAMTEMPAVAEVTEECSEDGSSCTVYEKVCTETECTVTSRICVVVGDQKACSDPVVTVVPVLTETPVQTEEIPAEPTATEEAPAEPTVTEEVPVESTVTEEVPAEPAVTEETPAEPTATEEIPAESTATEEVPEEPAVTEEVPAKPAATEEATIEPAVTEEVPEEPAVTEEVPAEPTVTEEAPAEPAATEEVPAEPAVTEEVPAEPAVTEEVTEEPAATEEVPAEPTATEEVPAETEATEESLTESVGMDEVSAEEVPTEDLAIREISIADLTEDTINFSAQESYTIAPEKIIIVPEDADWAELKFKLEDESVAAFKSTDIEVIRAEGLTIQGLQPGSTMLRIQAGELEKAVTLVISLSEADIQATSEAETAAQAAE